jgi:hypothetical protein
VKKGIESTFEKMGSKRIESPMMMGPLQHHTHGTHLSNTNEESHANAMNKGGMKEDGPDINLFLGQKGVKNPNLPRPPNILPTPFGDMSHNSRMMGDITPDGELFLDADDQASMGSVESDMEIIAETPRL